MLIHTHSQINTHSHIQAPTMHSYTKYSRSSSYTHSHRHQQATFTPCAQRLKHTHIGTHDVLLLTTHHATEPHDWCGRHTQGLLPPASSLIEMEAQPLGAHGSPGSAEAGSESSASAQAPSDSCTLVAETRGTVKPVFFMVQRDTERASLWEGRR